MQKHAAEHADEDSDVEEEVFLTKSGAPEKDNLLLPEVQAAMRNGGAQMAEETIKRGGAHDACRPPPRRHKCLAWFPHTRCWVRVLAEWVTPEFLKKLAAHPMLAEGASRE